MRRIFQAISAVLQKWVRLYSLIRGDAATEFRSVGELLDRLELTPLLHVSLSDYLQQQGAFKFHLVTDTPRDESDLRVAVQ